jgi:hypothetical protein
VGTKDDIDPVDTQRYNELLSSAGEKSMFDDADGNKFSAASTSLAVLSSSMTPTHSGRNVSIDDDDDEVAKRRYKDLLSSAGKKSMFGDAAEMDANTGNGLGLKTMGMDTGMGGIGSGMGSGSMGGMGLDMGSGMGGSGMELDMGPGMGMHPSQHAGGANIEDEDDDEEYNQKYQSLISSAKKASAFPFGSAAMGGDLSAPLMLISSPASQLADADMDVDVVAPVVAAQTSETVIVQRQRAALLAAPPRPLARSKDGEASWNAATTSRHTQNLLEEARRRRQRRQGGESKQQGMQQGSPRSDPNLSMKMSSRCGWGARGVMTQVVRNKQTGKYEVRILRLDSFTGEPPLRPASEVPALQQQQQQQQQQQHVTGFESIRKQAPLLDVLLTAQCAEREYHDRFTSDSKGSDDDDYADEQKKDTRRRSGRLLPPPSGGRLVAMMHNYAKLHEDAMFIVPPAGRSRQVRQSSVWRLVSALWGSPSLFAKSFDERDGGGEEEATLLEEPALKHLYDSAPIREGMPADVRRTHLMRRRLAVVAWLRATMQDTLRDDPASSSWDALSRLDIEGACEIAMQHSNYKLATLLSQSAGRQSLRTAMAEQVEIWKSWGAHQKMDQDLLRAYVLLSGNLDDDILRSDRITWFQDLAIRLCYNNTKDEAGRDSCTTSSTVARGLKSYRHSFASSGAKVPHVRSMGTVVFDVRYLLLELACLSPNESRIISRDCLTTRAMNSNPLDHAMSWHLFQTMRSIGLDDGDDGRHDGRHKTWLTEEEEHLLTSNYSAQLENAGLWHWAVYVAHHLPDEERREHRMKSILCRNCPKLSFRPADGEHQAILTQVEQRAADEFNLRVSFLQQEIGMDHSFVCLARVQRARYDNWDLPPDFFWERGNRSSSEYADMASAGMTDSLHRDLFLHLLPKCMLEGKEEKLGLMLQVLSEQSAGQGDVVEWDSAGGLVKAYLEVKKLLTPHKANADGSGGVDPRWSASLRRPETLQRLHVLLNQLTRNLGGATIQTGRLSLPEQAKTQHDTSGVVAKARRMLKICEQEMVGSISRWRFAVNELEREVNYGGANSARDQARFVVLKETGLIREEFGALTLGLVAGSLVDLLRSLLQKWLDAFSVE